jgi:hypothetical protein
MFLEALSRSGLVRASARAVGVGGRTVHDLRERDPEFARAWEEALAPFRRGERAYDRRPLAAFPAHRALAPLARVSAACGAVSVAELEARLRCSLDEYAGRLTRCGGDKATKRIAVGLAQEVRALARRDGKPHGKDPVPEDFGPVRLARTRATGAAMSGRTPNMWGSRGEGSALTLATGALPPCGEP